MPQPVFIRYDLVYTNGARVDMSGKIDRPHFNRAHVEKLLLDIQPEGTKIENMRATDDKGKDIPAEKQPAQFRPDPPQSEPPLAQSTSPVSPTSPTHPPQGTSLPTPTPE